MTTTRDDEKFIQSVIDSDLLEKAIDWIKSNLEPDDVFDNDVLINWALDNGLVEGEDK